MWMALIPLLSTIFGEKGPIGRYLKTKADAVQTQQELNLQIQKDKMALSGQLAANAVESEKNKLNATSQTFKAVSFILLNVPIIITCLSKVHGLDLWTNLALVPVWYAQLYVSVVFVIWGLPVVSNATSTIFSAIQTAFDARTDRQVTKIQAVAAVVNETVLADNLRKTLFKNGMTQEQWDSISNAVKQATSKE